jgi:hypothetical protein
MSTTTRRAVLAAAPAVAAGALAAGTAVNAVAIATGRASEPDPIFAVIRAHQDDIPSTLEADQMARGTVKWFNSQKGYGFIQPQDAGASLHTYLGRGKGRPARSQ